MNIKFCFIDTFITLKVKLISVENMTFLGMASWSYEPVDKCYVLYGHKGFYYMTFHHWIITTSFDSTSQIVEPFLDIAASKNQCYNMWLRHLHLLSAWVIWWSCFIQVKKCECFTFNAPINRNISLSSLARLDCFWNVHMEKKVRFYFTGCFVPDAYIDNYVDKRV